MAFDYSTIASDARGLLAEFGQPVSVRRVVGAAHDPVTGLVTGGAVTEFTLVGLPVLFRDEYFEGTLVQRGDRIYLLSADQEVQPGDKLVLGAVEVPVLTVQRIKPSNLLVAQKVLVRP